MDYEKLGFKAGIEIHQELATKKLFCHCSSALQEKELAVEVMRKIRAVAGETGAVDAASAYEQQRDRSFFYHGYEGEACLVELDEQPPYPVDDEAFSIALGVAKLFKLRVPDTICVMRKTVTDGSAVSGFQRTMLVGMASDESFLETDKGRVHIDQLNLEEDACKIEKRKGDTVFYSLSRLGIPLLEIGTDASIKDPAHVREVAGKIGMLLRSFNVKRGIGTIRQDVNVSIKGGARIEVKGWQDLKLLETLVETEVQRQVSLLEIKQALKKRKIKKFKRETEDVTDVFEKTNSKILSSLIKKGGRVFALKLPGFAGLLKKEICPGKTFGRELSEYAKAYGTKGMIHTDENLKKYKLEKEFARLGKKLNAKKQDLIIIVAEQEEVAKRAIDAVYDRALYALKGVPEETRIPNHKDATTSYARPLPGAHRLYPETDIPNISVTEKMLKEVVLPELLSDKIARFKKTYRVDESLAKELIATDFEHIIKAYDVEPKLIAQILVEYPKEIKTRYDKEIDVAKYLDGILSRLADGKISKEGAFEFLVEVAQGKKPDYAKYEMMPEEELEKKIKIIIKKNKGAPINALIGKVMAELRGKAPGKKIVDMVKKLA